VDLGKQSKVMGGNRFSLLQAIDPNPSNVSLVYVSSFVLMHFQLVVAAVLHMSAVGKV